jgi:hypothetical protein
LTASEAFSWDNTARGASVTAWIKDTFRRPACKLQAGLQMLEKGDQIIMKKFVIFSGKKNEKIPYLFLTNC